MEVILMTVRLAIIAALASILSALVVLKYLYPKRPRATAVLSLALCFTCALMSVWALALSVIR